MGRKALDVLKDIADQLGWKQPTTVENAEQLDKDDRKLVRAFNRVLRAMSSIDDWKFLRAEGEIELIAAYETGTMRLTNDSTTVSGQLDEDAALPVWTNSHIGRAVVVNGHPITYRVVSRGSATALTLDRAFMGTTSDGGTTLDDYNYKIVQDQYDLPLDFDRPVTELWTRFDTSAASDISVVEPDIVLARRRGRLPYSTGDPECVTLWQHDDAGEHRVAVFDQMPDEAKLVRFPYQKLHPVIDNDTQRILFPQSKEEMISAGVEFLILRGPEDDQRAQLLLGEFLQQQMNAVAKSEIGTKRTRLTISVDRIRHQKAKWGRKGLRIDWGSYFDRANFHDLP
jgi:hypothetical protein